jgi:putative transposase
MMCQVFGVSRSAYYDWLKRAESNRKKDDKKLVEEIKREHKASYETNGIRRIKAALEKREIKVGKNRIARLMMEKRLTVYGGYRGFISEKSSRLGF